MRKDDHMIKKEDLKLNFSIKISEKYLEKNELWFISKRRGYITKNLLI